MAKLTAAPVSSFAPGPPQFDASRFTPGNRRRLSAPAMRTFLAVADLWRISEEERLLVLGLPARSTYFVWVKAAREHTAINLPVDTLTRISAVLGIHKALRILFPTEREGVEWLRSPHEALPFGGQPPISLATGGTQDGLMMVRRFLDAARGGLFMPPNEADLSVEPFEDADIVFV